MGTELRICRCVNDAYIGYRLTIEYKFSVVYVNQHVDIYRVYLEDRSTFNHFTKLQFNKCFIDLTAIEERDTNIQKVLE
jgi:hypothetical protein